MSATKQVLAQTIAAILTFGAMFTPGPTAASISHPSGESLSSCLPGRGIERPGEPGFTAQESVNPLIVLVTPDGLVLSCGNDPVNNSDPTGLWNVFNVATWGVPNGSDVSIWHSFNPIDKTASWGGAWEGAKGGAKIYADTVTFNQIGSLKASADQLQGSEYTASRVASRISRTAVIGAGTMGGLGVLGTAAANGSTAAQVLHGATQLGLSAMAADSAGQNLGEATVDFETDHTVIGAVHAGLGLLDVTSAVTGTKAGFRDLAKFTRVVGKSGTTRLWRAVEPEELADVVKYGDYNIHPNSTFKRFAFDEGSLDNFIKANPGRDYTKTFIDVPTENLGQMYRHADPGGVGKAIGIDVYENPQFYDWFNKVEVLSK